MAETGQDAGGTMPTDPFQAGLAAKRRIEDEMGWNSGPPGDGTWKPWRWR